MFRDYNLMWKLEILKKMYAGRIDDRWMEEITGRLKDTRLTHAHRYK